MRAKWLVGSALAVACLAAALLLPPSPDWRGAFYPSAMAALHGHTPYLPLNGDTLIGFLNPPWLLALSLPVAALGVRAGWIVWFSLMATAFVAGLARLGFSRRAMVFILCTPSAWAALMPGNLEGLIFLGATLPPVWGLFLVLLKPQLGAGLAVYWTVLAWQSGGWRAVARLCLPVGVAFGLSFLVFGNYFARGDVLIGKVWNFSAFPFSIPLGVLAIALAVRHREPLWALAGSLALSPYANLWSIAALAVPVGITVIRHVRPRPVERSIAQGEAGVDHISALMQTIGVVRARGWVDLADRLEQDLVALLDAVESEPTSVYKGEVAQLAKLRQRVAVRVVDDVARGRGGK